MFDSINDQKILDTLKFKDLKIFLKEFHVQRTFEACQMLDSRIQLQTITEIYNLIEEKYAPLTGSDQILRILLSAAQKLTYTVEILEKSTLPTILNLQLITKLKQKSGLGKQNYKWSHREFWNEALKIKNPLADDIICLNLKNEITETSRCNLFFYDAQADQVLTPTLDTGCINGVYRRFVMQNRKIMLPDLGLKNIKVENIDYQKLSSFQIYVANSVREVLMAHLLNLKSF